MRRIFLAMLALLPTAAFGGIIPILTVSNTTINYGTNQTHDRRFVLSGFAKETYRCLQHRAPWPSRLIPTRRS